MRRASVLVAFALASCAAPPPPPEVPAADTSAMEPQVAAKIEAARDRVAGRPDSSEAWGELGAVYQAHALYAEAVDCYRRAIERAPREVRWPYLAALAELKLELRAALEFFAAAERLRPRNPAFYVNYGNTLLQLGEPDEAGEKYQQALALDSASTHALYGLGQVELARGDADAALEHLRTAADLAPRHGEVQALLARVHHRRGDAEAARLAELRARAYPQATRAPDPVAEAMEAEAVSSRSYTERGLRFARQGRFAEAEAAFRRVLEIRPGNARDFANLGGALARQGKTAEAVSSYQEALSLEPRDPLTRNNLGMAFADQGRLDAAAAQLEEAIRLDPAYAEAHGNLGLVRSRQGRVEAAVALFEMALELEPALVGVRVQLGTALAARGRLDEAVEHWRRALALDRRELSALYNLSVALARRGEHEEAIARLRDGLAVAPNSSRLASLLAWQLATAPRDDLRSGPEALGLARRVYEAYPEKPSSLDVMAAAWAETGRFEEAVRAAEQGLRLARASGDETLARQIERRLAAYRERRPYRQ